MLIDTRNAKEKTKSPIIKILRRGEIEPESVKPQITKLVYNITFIQIGGLIEAVYAPQSQELPLKQLWWESTISL